jgi:hypothetical protein
VTPLAALYEAGRDLLAEVEGWERFWSIKADVPFRVGDVRRLHWYASRPGQLDVLVQVEMVADDPPVVRRGGLAQERWTKDET